METGRHMRGTRIHSNTHTKHNESHKTSIKDTHTHTHTHIHRERERERERETPRHLNIQTPGHRKTQTPGHIEGAMEVGETEASLYTPSLFFSYTSCSPSLPFRLPYPTRVGPFGTTPDEKGVGNGGKESKRGKRRRRKT